MARATTGRYGAKSSPAIIREAQRLLRRGYTQREIAQMLPVQFEQLGGYVSTASVSYWCRGVTARPELALRSGEKVPIPKCASDRHIRRLLRDVASHLDQLNEDERRRLVRALHGVSRRGTKR